MIFTSDQLINLHVMFLPSKEIFFISTIKLCKYCPTQHQDLKTVKSSLTHESKYTAWGFVLLGTSIALTFSLAKRVGLKVPVWILFCWNAKYAPLRPGALAVPTSALTVHDRIVGRAWAVSAERGRWARHSGCVPHRLSPVRWLGVRVAGWRSFLCNGLREWFSSLFPDLAFQS